MVQKHTGMPLHTSLQDVSNIPWTISYVIRKRAQIDSFNELPKEKRPPDDIVWYGKPEDLDTWLDKVFRDNVPASEFVFNVKEDEIG